MAMAMAWSGLVWSLNSNEPHSQTNLIKIELRQDCPVLPTDSQRVNMLLSWRKPMARTVLGVLHACDAMMMLSRGHEKDKDKIRKDVGERKGQAEINPSHLIAGLLLFCVSNRSSDWVLQGHLPFPFVNVSAPEPCRRYRGTLIGFPVKLLHYFAVAFAWMCQRHHFITSSLLITASLALMFDIPSGRTLRVNAVLSIALLRSIWGGQHYTTLH